MNRERIQRPLMMRECGVKRWTEALPPRWVLAIHDDIAALFALALALQHCHIDLIPATTIQEAQELLAEVNAAPDILLVNCAIDGTFRLAKTLRERLPALKVVVIDPDKDHPCPHDEEFFTARSASAGSIPTWAGIICSLASRRSLAALRN